MFRPLRRANREIPLEEAKELLRNNKRAAFSVIGDEGYPFTVPINFIYDEEKNRILFHSAKAGHKVDAIRENDKVCFTTWEDGILEEGDWAYYVRSCVVFGRAEFITDKAEVERLIRPFAMKYYPTAEEVEVEVAKYIDAVQMIAINIEHTCGKRIHEK